MMAHPKWASENANVPVICIIFETMFFPILIVLLPVVFFSLKKKSSTRSVPTEYSNKRHSLF